MVVFPAGPISYDSIQLWIATTDSVAFLYFTGYVALTLALFLVSVESVQLI